jgi:hypothetical protein
MLWQFFAAPAELRNRIDGIGAVFHEVPVQLGKGGRRIGDISQHVGRISAPAL